MNCTTIDLVLARDVHEWDDHPKHIGDVLPVTVMARRLDPGPLKSVALRERKSCGGSIWWFWWIPASFSSTSNGLKTMCQPSATRCPDFQCLVSITFDDSMGGMVVSCDPDSISYIFLQ